MTGHHNAPAAVFAPWLLRMPMLLISVLYFFAWRAK
jgi:hypothetical protein